MLEQHGVPKVKPIQFESDHGKQIPLKSKLINSLLYTNILASDLRQTDRDHHLRG